MSYHQNMYTRMAEYGTDPLELPTTTQLINHAMLMLSNEPNSIFIGQSVEYDGTAMYDNLYGVPIEKRLEMPVAEDLQLGIAIGLAIQGFLPICIFPRIDFMLRAADQLVNHLDKLEFMSNGQYNPKVIIRTRIGSKTPLDAGPQHTQDHSAAFSTLLKSVKVIVVENMQYIHNIYIDAISSAKSVIVIEK